MAISASVAALGSSRRLAWAGSLRYSRGSKSRRATVLPKRSSSSSRSNGIGCANAAPLRMLARTVIAPAVVGAASLAPHCRNSNAPDSSSTAGAGRSVRRRAQRRAEAGVARELQPEMMDELRGQQQREQERADAPAPARPARARDGGEVVGQLLIVFVVVSVGRGLRKPAPRGRRPRCGSRPAPACSCGRYRSGHCRHDDDCAGSSVERCLGCVHRRIGNQRLDLRASRSRRCRSNRPRLRAGPRIRRSSRGRAEARCPAAARRRRTAVADVSSGSGRGSVSGVASRYARRGAARRARSLSRSRKSASKPVKPSISMRSPSSVMSSTDSGSCTQTLRLRGVGRSIGGSSAVAGCPILEHLVEFCDSTPGRACRPVPPATRTYRTGSASRARRRRRSRCRRPRTGTRERRRRRSPMRPAASRREAVLPRRVRLAGLGPGPRRFPAACR